VIDVAIHPVELCFIYGTIQGRVGAYSTSERECMDRRTKGKGYASVPPGPVPVVELNEKASQRFILSSKESKIHRLETAASALGQHA
jgi:hypothetical protein